MMEVTRKGVNPLKTAEEITAYLKLELADAHEQYDLAKIADKQQALIHLIRATTIQNILDAIK